MNYINDFNKRSKVDFLGFLIIIIYSANVFGYGIYLPLLLIFPMGLYLIKGEFSSFYILNVFILGSFSILFVLILHMNSEVSFGNKLMFLFFPVTMFLLGHKFVEKEFDLKKFIKFLYIIIISFTLFALLSFLNTILVYGNYEVAANLLKGRYVLSLWNNELITATGLNTYLSLSTSLLGVVFISTSSFKKGNLIKVLSLCLFIIGIYVSFIIGNRTSIIIAVVSFSFVILFSGKINKEKIASLGSVFLIALFSKIMFDNNWFNLKVKLETSNIYMRFKETNITEDSRINAWKTALEGLVKNPVNTKNINLDLNYAHNMWLDVGLVTGIFPFLLLILFNVLCIFPLLVFLKSNNSILIKGLLIGIFTAFYLQFFVEPIFQGWFTYFNIFCFVVGMLIKVNYNSKVTKI